MREVIPTSAFKRDYKKELRSHPQWIPLVQAIVQQLANDQPLQWSPRDHALTGSWRGCRECHLKPDWLLIYRLEPGQLTLIRLGSHAELFK
jgi:mRNA interferase YafQ